MVKLIRLGIHTASRETTDRYKDKPFQTELHPIQIAGTLALHYFMFFLLSANAFSIEDLDASTNLFLYVVMSVPCFVMLMICLFLTSQISAATAFKRRKSCDTMTTPPTKSLMAAARAVIEAGSKSARVSKSASY